ncbi:MAG TPA: FlgO family outer membrane protein, partial [Chthoniobacterales bacterium]|nr:FlgO family outer membrane protein [Chthoniobacterales bacterium]
MSRPRGNCAWFFIVGRYKEKMPGEPQPKLRLEIGHVLFLDIVDYSKLLISEQGARLQKLKEIIWATEQFRAAQAEGKLLRLPTGDGGALVFRTSPEAPVLCAQEISRALKSRPDLPVRMGIHSGPVNEVSDLNEQLNMAGAGINFAQRVMDCGEAGHVLLSKHVADDIDDYSEWRPYLHDLGECEVKHGVRVHLFNLYGEDFGNPAVPAKVQSAAKLARTGSRTPWLIAAMVMALAVIAAAMFWQRSQRTSAPQSSNAAPEKSIAVLPFENLSDEKQNTYFADGVQDEILTDLAKIADLKVISRSSVMQYKSGVARNLREIGQQLGVAHLVEGSVQRAANKVRVNAQLIDARTDAHQWAQVYDRPLDDVFAIQSEIAKAIAEQLQAKLSPNEKAAIEKPPTTDLAAFDLYTRAKTLLLSTTFG